jgi:DNA repair exonuclease SbcCD ATPase subunit
MFERISAENIFSWKSLNYEVKSGLSQISGINLDDGTREGAGKSSIFNILCWTLFGKIPKDVRIDEVIKQGEKYCAGRVDLLNGWSVYRSRNPNRFTVLDENEKELQGKDSKETQELLEKKLGLTFDLFCQSIYFSQNHDKKFITANETEKAKILSDIQGLSIYDKARDSAVKQIKAAQVEIISLNNQKLTNNSDLEATNKLIQFLQMVILDTEIKNQQILKKSKETKEGLQVQIKAFGEVSSQKSEVLIALENAKKEKKSLEDSRKQYFKLQTSIRQKELHENNLPNACTKCGHYPKGSDEDYKALNSYRTEIIRLEKSGAPRIDPLQNIEQLENDIESLRGILESLDIQEREKLRLEQKLETFSEEAEVRLKGVEKEHIKLEEEELRFGELREKIRMLNHKIDLKQELVKHLELLKDGFKEIKSYIFASILVDLSIKATDYALELFETPIIINFTNISEDSNLSKIETRITLDGAERSLGLLSGGQSRRVQLATDLALSEIVSKRAISPILFRIFDEASKDLSTVSIERFMKILERLPGSTIVVDHSELIQPMIQQNFMIKLENGISTEDSN